MARPSSYWSCSLADLRAQLDRALGSSYRIERELGGGGMSRVFLAEELALHRQVVIKVLPPEMAAGVSTDRFRREIEVAARLQHPHIVPVLASGAAEDLLYYTMPFIQGESLRAKLSREGELPVPEAARILREVADALAFAHSQGVVHRDVKPDNVMLSSGHALVTDFGVAKALEEGQSGQEGEADPSGLTSLGVALGTPTYMAPEQAAADPHVDHRADIYALGVMAYEMLAGQPPFTAPTPQGLLAAHVTQEPDPIRRYRSAVPEDLESVVLRCMAKRAADRFQQAAELMPFLDVAGTPSGGTMPVAARVSPRNRPGLVAGLFLACSVAVVALAWVIMLALGLPDWVMSGAIVLLVIGFPVTLRAALRERRGSAAGPLGTLRGALAAGGLAFAGLAILIGGFMGLRALGVGPFATLLSAGTLSERDPILVAEFENQTADSLLGPTLTEALTIDLSQSNVLRLVPTADVSDALERMQREPNTPLTTELAVEIAAREGIKAIVVGEIAPLASGYILSARVLSSDGETLFAARTTADGPGDLLGSLETLSRKLREGIGESLKSIRGTQGLEQVTTTSLEALELYTQAVRDWTEGQNTEALGLLRQAVALDPEFAMAWRRLAGDLTNANADPAEILAASQKAYDLRDRLPQYEALHTAAFHLSYDGADFDRVVEIYERILASWPDDKAARNNLGLYYRVIGRYADAERLMKPAVDSGIAPASTYYNLVATQIPQGKFDAADSTVALMTLRMPDTPMRWELAAFVAQGRNDFDAALAYADSLTEGGPRYRYWGHMLVAEVQRVRGQMLAANRASRLAATAQREQGSPGNALRVAMTDVRADLQFLGDTTGAARQLDALLAATPLESLDPYSRYYGDLIRLRAELGQLDEARRLKAEYESELPAHLRRADAWGFRGLATLAAAEGRHREALQLARRAGYLSGCDGCTGDQIAGAFEALGQADSAIVAWENLLRPPTFGSEFNHWRSVELPLAYRRLGELYEAEGDLSLAADRYAAFVDLWENADPELQPQVTEVRERLAFLAGEQ